MAKIAEVGSFQDLANLVIALSSAVNTGLMSREEATIIWKKVLTEQGLRQVPVRPAPLKVNQKVEEKE